MPFLAPSRRTVATWTPAFVRHGVRIELFILVMTVITLVLAIASVGTSVQRIQNSRPKQFNQGEITLVCLVYIIPPVVTTVVTIGNLLIYCNFCLHPAYSVSWAIVAMLGWVMSFVASLAAGAFATSPLRNGNETSRVLCSITSVLFLVIACGFFSYMVIAATAIDRARVARKQREHKSLQVETVQLDAVTGSTGPGQYRAPLPAAAAATGARKIQHEGHVEGDGRRCNHCWEHAEYYQ